MASKATRYANLDILRLFLATNVVVLHCMKTGLAQFLPLVATFVCLSGLLIPDSFTRSTSYGQFAIKRIARVGPGLIISLFIVALLFGFPAMKSTFLYYLTVGVVLPYATSKDPALWSLMLGPRLWSRSMRPRQRRSIVITNLFVIGLAGAIWWLVGWQAWLLVQMPSAILAGMAGVWLFYVQHQFEDVYWEGGERWGYADAALRGSSYLKLPQPLQFFTGSIGLHHVHHLSAKVPNYNLQRAHDENPIFRDVPVLTARDAAFAVRLKVIDQDAGRLLTWSEVRARRAAVPVASPAGL